MKSLPARCTVNGSARCARESVRRPWSLRNSAGESIRRRMRTNWSVPTIDSRRTGVPAGDAFAPRMSAYAGRLVRNQRSRLARSGSLRSIRAGIVVAAAIGSSPTTERTFSGTRCPSVVRSTS